MNELISVIVPVYNVDCYLERCIDSIRNQTYKELEIILVDDGSTDRSGQICDEYELLDERIIVIHKKNGGLSDARNTGIDMMSGQFITFIDSDDWVEPDYVKYLYNLINKYKADLSICDFNYVDSDNNLLNSPSNNRKEYLWNQKQAIKMLLDGKKIETSSTGRLYRASFFTENNIRFPYGRLFEDIPVTYNVLMNSNKVCFGNRALYNYFYRIGSISTMSFAPSRLHGVEHLESALKIVAKKYPQFKNDCKIAVFRMNYGIIPCFDETPENEEYRAKVLSNIKRTRGSVVFSANSSIKWKMKAITTLFGVSFVKKIYSK